MLGPAEADDGSITAGRFEDEMVRIFTDKPELLFESEVAVVDTHGAAHTTMFHRADAAGVDVTRSFSEMPFIYAPCDELLRKVAIGEEPTRELLIQCFADAAIRKVLFGTVIVSRIYNDPDIVQYFRTRSATFNEADAQKVFKTMQQRGVKGLVNTLRSPRHTIATINSILKEKGIGPLPSSEAEIYADIAKRADDLERKKAKVQAQSDARRDEAANGQK
jgi:hypothetical protein